RGGLPLLRPRAPGLLDLRLQARRVLAVRANRQGLRARQRRGARAQGEAGERAPDRAGHLALVRVVWRATLGHVRGQTLDVAGGDMPPGWPVAWLGTARPAAM